jgi:hypothetical protein
MDQQSQKVGQVRRISLLLEHLRRSLAHARVRIAQAIEQTSPSGRGTVKLDQPFVASRTARPAAARFASRISEYLRERMTPCAPALSAARVAA